MTYSIESYRDFGPTVSRWDYPKRVLKKKILDIQGLSEISLDPGVYTICMHAVFDDNIVQFQSILSLLARHGAFIDPSKVTSLEQSPGTGVQFHLTFDDGLQCTVRNGKDILNDMGIKATFFIPTSIFTLPQTNLDLLATANMRYRSAPKFLTLDDVYDLLLSGHALGNHTHSHSNLKQLSIQALHEELSISQGLFLKHFGVIPDDFAWPNGGIRHIRTQQITEIFNFGFKNIYSCVRGTNRHPIGFAYRHHVEPWFPLNHIVPLLKRSSN